MTDKPKTETAPNFQKFQYGYLAGRLLMDGDSKYISGSLELLAGKEGLNLSKEAQGFVKATFASEESLKRAAAIYSGSFQEALSGVKVSDYYKWFSEELGGLSDEAKSKFSKEVNNFGSEEYISLMKKIGKAERISKNEDGEYSKEKIENANKDLQKYQGISLVLGNLQNYKMEKLRSKAVEVTRSKDLESLAQTL